MKKLLFFLMTVAAVTSLNGQAVREKMLESLEQGQGRQQETIQQQDIAQQHNAAQQDITTATLKSAARLFGEKNDLTTVIMIIPLGSQVKVLGSDSTYYHVEFEENQGYILKRQATIDNTPAVEKTVSETETPVRETQRVQQTPVNRFTYLENKYGTNVAVKLNSGKIWKGMSAAMVMDSWGSPQKINRTVNGNTMKEEWIYKKTWLYFQENTLVEWGPLRK